MKKLILPSGTTYTTGKNGERICTGSQMGRRNILPKDTNESVKLRMETLRFVDGCYDQWGAYWGCGDSIYCAYLYDEPVDVLQEITGIKIPTETDYSKEFEVLVFVRAANRQQAKDKVKAILTNATFYR